MAIRTFWERMTCRPGYRLVREWVDACGHVVRFEVIAERP
jgi:hypothetical protein